MPTFTPAPWLRIALYLTSAIAILLATYFADKGYSWWGPPEAKLLAGFVALVNIMSATNVTRAPSEPEIELEQAYVPGLE